MTSKGLENRGDPRVSKRVQAVVFGAGGDLAEIPMETGNLSVGGAFCRSVHPLTVGRSVRLRLDLPGPGGTPQPIVVEAIVVRVEGNGPYGIAFHFVGTPPRIADLLRAFLQRAMPALP